jgi:hypothetical protein
MGVLIRYRKAEFLLRTAIEKPGATKLVAGFDVLSKEA